MILDLRRTRITFAKPPPKTWGQKLRIQLFRDHLKLIQSHEQKVSQTSSQVYSDKAGDVLSSFINHSHIQSLFDPQDGFHAKPPLYNSISYTYHQESIKRQPQVHHQHTLREPFIQQSSVDCSSHGPYSTYIPTKHSIKPQDQYVMTFPYLRHFIQLCNVDKTDDVYQDICKEFVKVCKGNEYENESINRRGKSRKKESKTKTCGKHSKEKTKNHYQGLNLNQSLVENEQQEENESMRKAFTISRLSREELISGLPKVKKSFIPQLDQIQTIDLYFQLLKYGTGYAKHLHSKYAPKCQYQPFFLKVMQACSYFKNKDTKYKKGITLSVQNQQLITEHTMSKTNKSLLCTVCLLYDCKHTVEDRIIQQNKFDFVSSKNVIPKPKHIQLAIKLSLFHQTLQTRRTVSQTINYDTLLQQNSLPHLFASQTSQACSSLCYLNLTHTTMQPYKLQATFRFLSPIVKSLIRMGLCIFSFQPCKIKSLFNEKDKMPCSLVFMFFFTEYNLERRLENKFFADQQEMMREITLYGDGDEEKEIVPPRQPQKKKIISEKLFTTQFSNVCLQSPSCFHYFASQNPIDIHCNSCVCSKRGFCIQQCLCSENCPIRRKGCPCKNRSQCITDKCPCYESLLQCQPGLCSGCFDTINHTAPACKNQNIVLNKQKLIRIGKSSIPGAGLGAFAGQFISKGSLAKLYTGEVIRNITQNFRQSLRLDETFYNFGGIQGSCIDSRYIGNKSRFVNHGNQGECNLGARHVYSKGKMYIGLYAEKDIHKDEQLFFNYDGAGDLYKNHRDKYPFIKKNPKFHH